MPYCLKAFHTRLCLVRPYTPMCCLPIRTLLARSCEIYYDNDWNYKYVNAFFSGRQYDKDGNLDHWWKPEIIENFKEKAQCIVDQYGRYVVPKVNKTVGCELTNTIKVVRALCTKHDFSHYLWLMTGGSMIVNTEELKLIYHKNISAIFISYA